MASTAKKQADTVVLDEEYDADYEPNAVELAEYASYIGMHPDTDPLDQKLMWIAREGLKAPLPKDWKPCQSEDGDVYYFNFKTGQSIWDHPSDEHYRNKFAEEKDRLVALQNQPLASAVASRQRQDSKSSSQSIPAVSVDAPGAGDRTSANLKTTAPKINLTKAAADAKQQSVVTAKTVAAVAKQAEVPQVSVTSVGKDRLSLTDSEVAAPRPATSSSLSPTKQQQQQAVLPIIRHLGDKRPDGEGDEDLVTSIINLASEARRNASQVAVPASQRHSADEDRQRDVVQRMLFDKIEDLKRQMEDKERDERKINEERMTALRTRFENERVLAEREEKLKQEQSMAEYRRQLHQEFDEQKREEERHLRGVFDQHVDQVRTQLEQKEERERAKLDKDLQDRLKQFRKDLDDKYKEVTEDEYKPELEAKKKVFQLEGENELEQLRLTLDGKKRQLQQEFVQHDDAERVKHNAKLDQMKKEWQQVREQEEQQLQQQLHEVKLAWQEKRKRYEREVGQQEANLKSQLTLAHQQQLKDREHGFVEQMEQLEAEWSEKLSKLRRSLEFEQSALEDKLVMMRSHNLRDSESTMAASLQMKKQELQAAIAEHDKLLAVEKQKAKALDKTISDTEKVAAEHKVQQVKYQAELAKFKSGKSSKRHSIVDDAEDINDLRIDGLSDISSLTASDVDDIDDEVVDAEAVPQDGSKRIEPSSLVQELNRRLRVEQDHITTTKQHIRHQQSDKDLKQAAVDDVRSKWRADMEAITSKLHQPPQMLQEHDQPFRMSEMKQPQPSLTEELSGVLNSLRQSYSHQPAPAKSYLPPMRNDYAHFSTATPKSGNISHEIKRWDQDRKRTDEMLKSHSQWLHQFRQKVGLQQQSASRTRASSVRY